MTPHLESNWEQYIQHVKFWRTEVKRSLGEMISNLEIVSNLGGKSTIFGLAAAPGDSSSNQILMHADIPLDDIPLNSDDMMEDRPILELKPMFDFAAQIQLQTPSPKQTTTDDQQQSKLPSELALHYERLRGQLSSGVVSYERHAESGAFLISTFSQLFVYKNNKRSQIAQWLPQQSFLMNASFCKTTSDFVAFTSGNQLFIDRNGILVFKSDNTLPNTSNGVASFITQEEFERYDGYWWSPTRVEILYERVDESEVGQLVPGGPGSENMRYPLAGTKNATSMPRICCLVNNDEENCSFDDLGLDNSLTEFVPWMEYIVRMGWTSRGDEVFLAVMNRNQTRMAILLVPRTLFVSAEQIGKGFGNMKIIYEETSTVWINWNNLLRFLLFHNQTDETEKKSIHFILGSEITDKCHLYLQSWDKENGTTSKQITSGKNWVVLKEAIPKVDQNRRLVYFLAERISPIILSLCVAAIPSSTSNKDEFTDCRVLTPEDLSYKFERCNPSLCLNPDVGFICWLSAVNRLPECRFYRFVHGNEPGTLPSAVFTHRIGVQVVSPSPSVCSTSSWGLPYLHRSPSSIFKHKFCEFESTASKERHFALALWPSEEIESKKFPIIHSVYAGPTIQIVRNAWHSISQFLKFLAYGYAVVIVDGRGSANRGVSFEGQIKESLGTVELEDQLEGLNQAIDQTGDILDKERVVCIGWSYGGYMSIQLLAEYPNIYKASVVGGAVADWQLYDTAYTERYMGTPQQNAEAYKKSSVISKVDMLPNQDGRILIVHGMLDENVHFQHAILLINALIKSQKPHQLLLFPSERHAIRNGESMEYFHASVLSFFRRALGLGVKNENVILPKND